MLIVGLDLSLTNTGISRALVNPDAPPSIVVLNVKSKPPPVPAGHKQPLLSARSRRLRHIAGDIIDTCRGASLIVVEAPAYSKNQGAAHDRAGLWWLVVARLTGAGLHVVEVEPTVVKVYATGKGNVGKDEVLAAVVRRYVDVPVADNNQADALVLAAMGARFAKLPIEPGGTLPQTHTRAMLSPKWAPNERG